MLSAQQAASTEAWKNKLSGLLRSPHRKVALVGVGNPLCHDDYVGSKVVKMIINSKGTHVKDVYLVDAENNVEFFITKIQRIAADHVIFVDACRMGLKSGSVSLLAVEDTSYPFFTTHGIPLKLLAERMLPESRVWVLAIEPKRTDFGEGLSREVADSARAIQRLVISEVES